MDLKIGDIVEIHTNHQYGHPIGTIGKIIKINKKGKNTESCEVIHNNLTFSHSSKYLKLVEQRNIVYELW